MPLRVREAMRGRSRGRAPSRRAHQPAAGNRKTLFVGNLPFSCSMEDLYKIFQRYCRIEEVFLSHFPGTSKSRGYAFIRYRYEDDAWAAIGVLDGGKGCWIRLYGILAHAWLEIVIVVLGNAFGSVLQIDTNAKLGLFQMRTGIRLKLGFHSSFSNSGERDKIWVFANSQLNIVVLSISYQMFTMQEGDRNTKFFHVLAKDKIRRAGISHILDDQCQEITNLLDIKSAAISHFQSAFQADPSISHSDLSHIIPSLISANDNASLVAPPSIQEVQQALSAIPKDGALGPNGFTTAFFSSCWTIVGPDLVKAAAFWFQGGPLPKAFCLSLICLIPKGAAPASFGDFRPISLCNVVYKLFSKMLATRLRLLLPNIISLEQGAFISGRPIIENIALAQELVRNLNRKVRGGNLMLKLDLEKAYDRVDWTFLKGVLKCFDFDEASIALLESC
ncbi:uncharacterized protein LOC131221988 [Magnolia sinica]|uniref:uncharacterized protein LOC131221988 n=1 Tax=Magnolia sinica TaxID=86752 RepID=UPI0026599C27|nr:uncharacterized protein LOC131221988 [Magnolia sinica]